MHNVGLKRGLRRGDDDHCEANRVKGNQQGAGLREDTMERMKSLHEGTENWYYKM